MLTVCARIEGWRVRVTRIVIKRWSGCMAVDSDKLTRLLISYGRAVPLL